jgi:hypothetical protein
MGEGLQEIYASEYLLADLGTWSVSAAEEGQHTKLVILFIYLFIFAMLGTELRTLHMLVKCSVTKLCIPRPRHVIWNLLEYSSRATAFYTTLNTDAY